ncbi:type II toxin-antitoxin system RelE/ParE family toxin [Variovorax beijingensis]|uniref:Type II toxin-antitoxin system RelE/ParE family toxin n=1 Tax=Variovorax beijingensis TaxID=2496117 RepID=A0A3P3EA12_9BURK|nr:type II toxin-antitoxin system RelE/ParE family toxin [Variovorax beijingensis]RRH81938.1 type II toxin-antitoxin system RelE/ParE family toxin [Variovorax beijingensis]
MSYRVVFSPEAEAEEQPAALYSCIAAAASPEIAARYTEAIVAYCEGLRAFPHRGIRRDDVRPGLRIVDAEQVSIIGVFYGGQDCETALEEDCGDDLEH